MLHSNRFEVLSSDDEQVVVPSTVPASEEAIRVARRRSLVILSDSVPVAHHVPPSTIPDAGSEDVQHHIIGTPAVSDIEDPASDDTLSIVGGAHVGEEASVFSEDIESVGGDVTPTETELDPTPLEDVNTSLFFAGGNEQFGRSGLDGSAPSSSCGHEIFPKIHARRLQIRAQVRPPGGQRRQGNG